MIPPLFVLSLFLLVFISTVLPVASKVLGVELGIYGSAVIVSSALEAWKRKDVSLFLSFPLALVTMHLAWGGAFLIGLICAILGICHGQ
jgi:hypothetical protein